LNFLYFVPEEERAKLVQHLISFGKEKTVGTIEHQVELPGKGFRWLQRTDRAIFDDDGQIFEFQSVGRDITDRKRMEAQIQAAQAHLVQAARMATIGEMASGVAHQIYNPLTTIIADVQILLRKMSSDHPGRESAEAIEQAGWRLQKVVQRLMDFSQPENEAHTSIKINETIRSAISMVNSHIEAAGCRLEENLQKKLPPVTGNSRQLESLWVNLLLLARDACVNSSGNLIQVL
jgi:C4-dicarboxylate-specific signal transduction histidine kinase